MLTTLGRRRAAEPTLLERFTDCHERIRKFCALARRLAQTPGGEEARQAAAELHRYFSVALPLHVADEEQSLAPRLGHVGDDALADHLEAMTRDHVEIDGNLVSLLDGWKKIVEEPSAARCAATRWEAACLLVHFEHHLYAEETHILPLIARLPPAYADAIASEMRARRQA